MSSNRKVYLFKHINKKVDQKDIELGAAYEDKNLFKQGPIKSEANVELIQNDKNENNENLEMQNQIEKVNDGNVFKSESYNKHWYNFMKVLELIFYPQLKILMDILFFIAASIACLVVGTIGFMIASLFFIYLILLLIPKTNIIGKILLELSGLVVAFFFFKFIIIVLFFPWAIWMYIKCYIKIFKNEINPDNTFKENFSVLTQDYYNFFGFFNNFIQNMQKVDEVENKQYSEVDKDNNDVNNK